MAFSNQTAHYGLPEYVGSDRASWLDTNQAFEAIDTALYNAVTALSQAAATIETLSASVAGLSTSVAGLDTRLSLAETDLTKQNLMLLDHDALLGDSDIGTGNTVTGMINDLVERPEIKVENYSATFNQEGEGLISVHSVDNIRVLAAYYTGNSNVILLPYTHRSSSDNTNYWYAKALNAEDMSIFHGNITIVVVYYEYSV